MTYLVIALVVVSVIALTAYARLAKAVNSGLDYGTYRRGEIDRRTTNLFNEMTEKFASLQDSCIQQVDELNDRVENSPTLESIQQTNADIRRLQTRLDGVTAAMESLKNDRLNTLNAKLNKATEAADNTAKWIEERGRRIDRMERQFDGIDKVVQANENQIGTLNGSIATARDVETVVNSLKDEVCTLKRRSTGEENKSIRLDARITAIESKLAELNEAVLGDDERRHRMMDDRRQAIRQAADPHLSQWQPPPQNPLKVSKEFFSQESDAAQAGRAAGDAVVKILEANRPPIAGVDYPVDIKQSYSYCRGPQPPADSDLDRATFEAFVTPHHTPEDDVSYLDPKKDPFNDGR